MLLTCWLLFSTWVMVIVWFFLYTIAYSKGIRTLSPELSFLGILFIISASLAFTLSMGLRCDVCQKRLLAQVDSDIDVAKAGGMTKWGKTVLQVIRGKLFRCMHCGTEYSLGK